MRTSKDYTFTPFGFEQALTVPAGTRLTNQTAFGIDKNYHFVDEFGWIPKDFPLFKHDAIYRGINVPIEYVDFEN
jgi:hypothetical protein